MDLVGLTPEQARDELEAFRLLDGQVGIGPRVSASRKRFPGEEGGDWFEAGVGLLGRHFS